MNTLRIPIRRLVAPSSLRRLQMERRDEFDYSELVELGDAFRADVNADGDADTSVEWCNGPVSGDALLVYGRIK